MIRKINYLLPLSLVLLVIAWNDPTKSIKLEGIVGLVLFFAWLTYTPLLTAKES